MTREISYQSQSYQAPTPYQPKNSIHVDTFQTTGGFVSVFDDPTRLEHCLKMAQILANSLFVPESKDPKNSFRGNPENCLIALDLAGRLGLAPTALFPHLYVINGRPSMSAQFVIALVNRSGRFTRIQWEEGQEGPDVTFDNYGKQQRLPNYYAIAYFTDLATGETLRSTKIDVELARRSGWLGKNESKWKTIPREMCRWRSAAWLCKNYAPELIMGIEFEDEMEDEETADRVRTVSSFARSVAVSVDAEATRKEEEEPDDEKTLLSLIGEARTLAELNDAATKIGASDVSAEIKSRLRLAYKKRREELVSAIQEEPTDVEEEEAPKPKPTRKRATKKAEPAPEPAPEVEEVSYTEAIAAAPTLDDLTVVVNSIVASAKSGTVSAEEYESLMSAADIRERDLIAKENAENERSAPPTERQAKNFDVLYEGIQQADNPDKIQKAREAIADARERNLITNDQATELFDACQDVAGGLLF